MSKQSLRNKQFLAILWKEYRQLRSVIIIMSGLGLLYVYLTYSSPPDMPFEFVQNTFVGITLLITPMLAFFLGAGVRIVERVNHLGGFMRLRPIEFRSLLTYYFGIGLLGWAIFLTFYWIAQILFFGMDILGLFTGPYRYGYPLLSYLNVSLLYFSLYSIAFCAGILIPHYMACSSVCWSLYSLAFYFLISDRWMEITIWIGIPLPTTFYIVFLLPIPFLLYGTYLLQKHTQLGCR